MENTLSATIQSTGLGYSATDETSEQGYFGISRETWLRVLLIAALFAAAFWPNLKRLWLKTNPFTGEANWSHAVVVPIVGLYYLFIHREDLIKAHAQQFIMGSFMRPSRLIAGVVMVVCGGAVAAIFHHSASLMFSMLFAMGTAAAVLGLLVLLLDWSLATILFGIGFYVFGIYPGRDDYAKDLGMIITLFGIVLTLTGWNVMRIAWFPIAFLICAIPWPGLVYSWVAEPLSQMAAWVAVKVLNVTGVDAVTSGTKIMILNAFGHPIRTLNVEEACAGMRSLMTFLAIGGAIAFLSARPLWQKLTIMFSAVPIAIFCNMARISGTGLLDHYVSPKWSESFAHQFVGMMLLVPAFFLLLLVGFILDRLFIEEADEEDAGVVSKPKQVAGIVSRGTGLPAMAGATALVPATAEAAVITRPAAIAATPKAPPSVAPTINPANRPVGAPPAGAPPTQPGQSAVARPPGAQIPRPANIAPVGTPQAARPAGSPISRPPMTRPPAMRPPAATGGMPVSPASPGQPGKVSIASPTGAAASVATPPITRPASAPASVVPRPMATPNSATQGASVTKPPATGPVNPPAMRIPPRPATTGVTQRTAPPPGPVTPSTAQPTSAGATPVRKVGEAVKPTATASSNASSAVVSPPVRRPSASPAIPPKSPEVP